MSVTAEAEVETPTSMDIDFGDDAQKNDAVQDVAQKKAAGTRGRTRTNATKRKGVKGAKGAKGAKKALKTVAKKAGKGAKSARPGAKAPGKKPRRWKSGTVALREIRKYQKSNELQLRKLPFSRLVREVMQDVQGGGSADDVVRIGAGALLALQEAAESYVVELFECTNQITVGSKRSTILPRDMALVQKVQMQGLSKKYT